MTTVFATLVQRMPWLQQVRSELADNARLRLGLLSILATVWLWTLLLLHDHTEVWRNRADEVRAEVERLRPLQATTQWPERAEEARKQLEAAKALLWSAGSQGLAEAALQDTLRSWSEKAGLPVRELSVGTAGESLPGGIVPLRARMVVDFNRIGLMGLLAELGRSPKLMAVDSVRLRPMASPPRAELEVRVLFRPEERKP